MQPKNSTRDYAKPGDVLDLDQPVLFTVADRRPGPSTTRSSPMRTISHGSRGARTAPRSRSSTTSAATRCIASSRSTPRRARAAVISEEPKTFFTYSGKKYRHDVPDGREVVWMSERDGWNHLYLVDGATGEVKNPITKGDWVGARRVAGRR